MKKLLLFSGLLFVELTYSQSYSYFNFNVVKTNVATHLFASNKNAVIAQNTPSAANAAESTPANNQSKENLSVYVYEELLHLKGFDPSAPLTIVIYNAVGQCLITIKQSPELPIDISSLNKGIYFVKVGTASFKFVKR